MTSEKPLFRTWLFGLVGSFSLACLASRVEAAPASPSIAISTETYHGSGAASACKLTLQRARVVGVPAAVAARIDGILDGVVRTYVRSSPTVAAAWSRDCAEARHDWERYGTAAGMPFVDYEQVEWTRGYARGRWLSVRFHATSYAGGAHPSDAYESDTFDLAHGGYPVPTGGFFPRSSRAALNRSIGDGMVRDAARNRTGEAEKDVRAEAVRLDLDASHFLLTERGIEVSGYYDFEAGRNAMMTLPFSKLDALGTPGGPLDPSTR